MRPVMIVDDEDFAREHLANLIRRRECAVCCAEDGRAALEAFSTHKPGLVFLDIHMPQITGDAVLVMIKKIDPSVKVYFVTGSELDITHLREKKADAEGYLLKPIDIPVFNRIIDDYITAG